ncbi:MAG: hypothetical protein KF901_29410 [Myxococcales bacterium]|nr:hypothetical protein [Myxococcales bacterium]
MSAFEPVIEEQTLHLAEPVGNARRRWSARTRITLTLRTDDGEGRGEAAPLPGFGEDSLERARAALHAVDWGGVAREIAPVRPLRDVLERVEAHVAPSPSARFAVETAVLDLLARRRGLPAWALLGPLVADSAPSGRADAPDAPWWMTPSDGIDVAGLEGGVPTPAIGARGWILPEPVAVAAWPRGEDGVTLLESARGAAREGFGTLKIKLGRQLDVELAVARTLRREHPELRLRFDANRSLTERQLPRVLDALAAVGAELLEEPVPLDVLARIEGAPAVPFALDESLSGREGPLVLARLLDRGVVGAAVIKPMALGLRRAIDLANIARRRGAGVIVSHLLDGPLAYGAASALALALGDRCAASARLAHGLGPHAVADALGLTLAPRIEAQGGPGLALPRARGPVS